MATKATNSAIDALASAIASPYGPLVRVTDADNDTPDPNKDIKLLFDTAISGVQVELSYNELANADIAAAIIAQAFNFQEKIESIVTPLDDLNTAVQAMALPHTIANYRTVYDGVLAIAKTMGIWNG